MYFLPVLHFNFVPHNLSLGYVNCSSASVAQGHPTTGIIIILFLYQAVPTNSVNFSCVYSFSVTEAAVAVSLFVHTQMDILDFIRHNCSSKMVTVQFLLNPFFRFESIMNQHRSDQRPLIVIKHGASLHVAQI